MMNFTEREVRGAQMAGVGNILEGDLTGYQAAGVFNLVGGGEAAFVQAAGVFNVNQGAFRGLQAAGVFNLAQGPLTGAQMAGVFNRAPSVAGAQVGLVNISGDVQGSQVGLVNVAAGEVRGTQVGLVNISRSMRGLPVGLVSVSEGSAFSLSAYVSEDALGYVGLQLSSGLLYTVLYGGTRLTESPTLFAAGLGLGLHLPMGPFYVETDIGGQQAFQTGPLADPDLPAFPAARLLVGWKMYRSLALFGGVLLNGHIPGATELTPLHTGTPLNLRFSIGSLELYPKLVAGLRV
jgi:hypothetical protein